MSKVKLDAFEEIEGTSLMTGTGVTYEDIYMAVYNFNKYAVEGRGNLFSFFNKKNLSNKVIKALALIGMKHVCDELYTKMKGDKDGGEETTADNT